MWEKIDTVTNKHGTKIDIIQHSINYATRNQAGTGVMDMSYNPIAHNPAYSTPYDSEKKAEEYANNIVNQLKNYGYVIGTQASISVSSIYLMIPLNYAIPHAGNYDYNNHTFGAELFGENSKEEMDICNSNFNALMKWAHAKYGSPKTTLKNHNEVSSTACPKRSLDFWGTNQAVKDNINNQTTEGGGNVDTDTDVPENNSEYKQISWVEADKISSTVKGTGERIKYAKLSGAYPSGHNTFGHLSPTLGSGKVYFKEMNEYAGYILDSADSIVWFEITNIKGTKGETIYLDLNEPNKNYFYYNATDNATILKTK